ncbi:putative 5-formyltetrahydrofolate cyclo-ligase [Corynebacterium capitovis DSM 44611]|nr:putative 5-formyltetrahydrofolate cyclo-ligase [Corynebacterium capitovis DSM 44611]
MTSARAKELLRRELLARRRQLRDSPERKAELDSQITRHALALVRELNARTVAAYDPFPTEPAGRGFPAALAAEVPTLLLPVTLPHGLMAWKDYEGSEQLPPGILASCDVVLVPAAAVDKSGLRLGKGGGYYDRALAGLSVPTAAVVYHDEYVHTVPHDPHDVAVSAIITEEGWWRSEGTKTP